MFLCLAVERRPLDNVALPPLNQLPTAEQHAPQPHTPAAPIGGHSQPVEEQRASVDAGKAAELQRLERNLRITAQDDLTAGDLLGLDAGFLTDAAGIEN